MSYVPIKDWSSDEQPREKLEKWGAETLSLSELLAILIRTGSKGRSAIQIAKEILDETDNDINKLAKYSVADFMKTKGLGKAKSISIITALELGRRRKNQHTPSSKITSAEDAISILKPLLMDKNEEHFYILLLSTANKVIKTIHISKGGLSSVVVDPKIVMREALVHHSAGIILAHNHPSGALKPSLADIKLTEKISKAGEMMDIRILDHIIIGGDDYYSFSEDGKL